MIEKKSTSILWLGEHFHKMNITKVIAFYSMFWNKINNLLFTWSLKMKSMLVHHKFVAWWRKMQLFYTTNILLGNIVQWWILITDMWFSMCVLAPAYAWRGHNHLNSAVWLSLLYCTCNRSFNSDQAKLQDFICNSFGGGNKNFQEGCKCFLKIFFWVPHKY